MFRCGFQMDELQNHKYNQLREENITRNFGGEIDKNYLGLHIDPNYSKSSAAPPTLACTKRRTRARANTPHTNT